MSVEQQSNDKSRHTPYTGLFLRLILVILLNGLVFPKILERQIIDTDYGTFLSMVAEGNVKQVKIEENRIYFLAVNADNTEALYQTGSINDPELVNRLLDATSPNETGKIVFTQTIPRQNSPLLNFLLMWILPGASSTLYGNRQPKAFKADWEEETTSCRSAKAELKSMPNRK